MWPNQCRETLGSERARNLIGGKHPVSVCMVARGIKQRANKNEGKIVRLLNDVITLAVLFQEFCPVGNTYPTRGAFIKNLETRAAFIKALPLDKLTH